MADLNLPAPDAPAEEWGRLAVSLSGWRWMPGMLGVVYQHRGIVSDHRVQRGTTLLAVDRLPATDDAATAGCLLALLGEWNGYAREKYVYSNGRVTPYRAVVRSCVDGITHESTTLGRACIAAAAALGRWPGGTP
jgi:hypothetical protein